MVHKFRNSLMASPVFVNIEDRSREGWSDSIRGHVSWYTLFSGDITPTDTMIAGVAELIPGGILNLHRHSQAEIYFVIEGQGTVTVDGKESIVGPGSAVFIPSDAEHGIKNDFSERLRFFYTFSADCFSDIEYKFQSN
jgi:quercetin dioxygenase-like cupin family protein